MRDTPRIAGLVLAAGFSKRFGQDDKLAARLGDTTVLEKALAAYASPRLARKILVLQPDSPHADSGRAAGFEIVENPNADDGMGSSIARAVAGLEDETHALIGLGDMPYIRPGTVDDLCRAVDPAHSIIIPTHDGARGHPRLFSSEHFPLLARLTGDAGARGLIAACPRVFEFAVNDAGITNDIDTPDALAGRA